MVQPKHRIKFTVKDYMSMLGDKQYQLLDGELILTPSSSDRHQFIALNLVMILQTFIRSSSLGRVRFAPLDVVLSEYDVAQPDILFVSNSRSDIVTEANIQGAPDLVVEILSPGTAAHDLGYKQALYGGHGVREYWIVDPEAEAIEVLGESSDGLTLLGTYRLGQIMTSPLLEGLAIDLQEIFRK